MMPRSARQGCRLSVAAASIRQMSAQPTDPLAVPDTEPYEVIHLGGEAAVLVPLEVFLRLRALEQLIPPEDREDIAGLRDWKARDRNGESSYVPHDEVRRRLGLPA
jgi:hypothetical protein